MASQLIETLLVSSTKSDIAASLNAMLYHVQTVNEPGHAMEMLRNAKIDLVLLEDELFSVDINQMVKEIKRRVPLMPVLVFFSMVLNEKTTFWVRLGVRK